MGWGAARPHDIAVPVWPADECGAEAVRWYPARPCGAARSELLPRRGAHRIILSTLAPAAGAGGAGHPRRGRQGGR
eukprot:6735415-Pyramimonas_sp.AAC.1